MAKRESRAFGPGSRRASSPRITATLLLTATALLASGCGAAKSTAAHAKAVRDVVPAIPKSVRAEEQAIHRKVLASLHSQNTHARYGGIPAYLRNKQAPPRDQVLSATASHPVYAIQGNSVRLHLAHGSALATAVGPDLPDRVQGSADLHSTATWYLTFNDVDGTVPLAPRLFSITDEQGSLLLPQVRVVGGGHLPKTVPRGRPFTLVLSTVVSVGDGKLRYAPSGGPWLVEWDFDVETD